MFYSGIGVDDVFVIVGALTSLTPEEATQPIHEKMSLMLRHAGVSITVTSLTDIVAFGIGATTVSLCPNIKVVDYFMCIIRVYKIIS